MIRIINRLKPGRWSRKRLIIAAAAATAVLLASFLFVYKSSKAGAAAANFATATVQRGTIEYSIDGTGTLRPAERYALKTWAGGTVTEVLVTEGEQVKKGQLLMRVKNNELDSAAKQAALEWEIAQSDLEEMYSPPSETNYERRAAELKVEQYRLSLEDKKEQQEKLTIKAPFDGTLLETKLLLGQRVNSGVTAATFATTDVIEMVADFSSEDVLVISPGKEANINVSGLNRTYKGHVREVAFVGDSSSGTFETIIEIDDPDEYLREGMKAYSIVIIARDPDQDIFIFKSASGYLRYAQSEDIVTEVSGTVAEIYHKPGDRILKGEPIMRLANDEYARQVKEAENQLANAEEELRLLLHPDQDTIKAQELKVEQNYQKVLAANKKLESLNVIAPIDGVVTSIAVSPGDELGEDTSSAGQELLVVCNFEKNYLEIQVDELDINKIKFGQESSVKIDALPDAVATGKVIGIAQEGTTSDGVTTYTVTLEVGYVEGIKGGMSATATISLEKKENVLRIPSEALVTSNGASSVQVLENGQAITKPVKTGVNTGRWVEITSGLEEGEQVIIAKVSSTSTTQQAGPPPDMGGPGGMGGAPGQQRSTTTKK
ncbi:MAG: efflux RND transporter periplasmic adaptor subunit [Peptococcaceae bacterium]|nr:efflux RND transporter periplasmic adaptor subunit [Peptococcaceae bacterium]MDH7524923.1 efflux RND transporter periplasmic adaptor subunit [Peptococcaceae bacterium]